MQSVGWRLSFARLKALGLLLMPPKHICRLMDLPNASEGVPDGIPDIGVFEGALYDTYESDLHCRIWEINSFPTGRTHAAWGLALFGKHGATALLIGSRLQASLRPHSDTVNWIMAAEAEPNHHTIISISPLLNQLRSAAN